MADTLGVWAEPLGSGVAFVGPSGRRSWSPMGSLSSALGFVVGHEVAAHPWDPWAKEDAARLPKAVAAPQVTPHRRRAPRAEKATR